VLIGSYGCVAQADGYSKQWAKNAACEITIDRILRSNPKARAIIKDLLVKQGRKALRVVNKIIATKPEAFSQEIDGYHVQTMGTGHQIYMQQTLETRSLYELLKNDQLVVEKLAMFSDSMGLALTCKLNQLSDGLYQSECTLEGLRSQGFSFNKRTVHLSNSSRRSSLHAICLN
jgi:hypothetical protein